MSAVAAPTVELNVPPAAAAEIKKFMAGEDDLPETAGLRVRVVPGGCSGFQYSLNIEEESRQGDFVIDKHGIRLFVDMFSAQYLNGIDDRSHDEHDGFGLYLREPERHRRLRLRHVVLGVRRYIRQILQARN